MHLKKCTSNAQTRTKPHEITYSLCSYQFFLCRLLFKYIFNECIYTHRCNIITFGIISYIHHIHTSRWGKTLDIVASSIKYIYYVNKTHNSILNAPWFHTPASHFYETEIPPWAIFPSKNGKDELITHFWWHFLPISCLTYRPKTKSMKIPVRATSRFLFIYSKMGVWVAVK